MSSKLILTRYENAEGKAKQIKFVFRVFISHLNQDKKIPLPPGDNRFTFPASQAKTQGTIKITFVFFSYTYSLTKQMQERLLQSIVSSYKSPDSELKARSLIKQFEAPKFTSN